MSKLTLSLHDLSCAELSRLLGCRITEMVTEGNTVTISSSQPLSDDAKAKLRALLGSSELRLGQMIEK